MLQDAIDLIKRGIRVMPVHSTAYFGSDIGCTCGNRACRSIAKHPIFLKWQNIIEADVQTAKGWYLKYPWANLGVITGKISQVVVLDIDPKNGGMVSLQELEKRFGEIPETPIVRTGSGGTHYYFRHPGYQIPNRANMFGGGIDFRGDGGFVVAPESRHISGSNYEWEASPRQVPFADMPTWLQRELHKKETAPANPSGRYSEGGRNNWLTSIAGGLRRKGLGYKPIMACLWYSNLENCNPPLDADEVRMIAHSICRYPPGGMA